MSRLRGRVARLEARIASRVSGAGIVETLEAARRGQCSPMERPTLAELRVEMTVGGWRAALAEARARLWYWSDFVRVAAP